MQTLINGLPIEAYALCGCQCGDRCNAPGSTFRPGHDARLVSKLLKAVKAGEITIDEASRKAVTSALAQKLRDAHRRAEIKAEMKAAGATNRSADKMAKGATFTAGTIKIGRWTYPTETRGGYTLRNTKTDGSGEWVTI